MLFIRFALITTVVLLSGCSSQEQSGGTQSVAALLVSDATYDEVNMDIGCDSKYIDEKKADLFYKKYLNHWMTWEGKVFYAESESVSLDMNNQGIHELQAVFSDPKVGYDILKGSTVSIHFVMRGQGGCFLPFSGDSASIVRK